MAPLELKHWKSDLGLSDQAFAAYLGVPKNTASKWLDGTRNPDAAPLRLMATLRRIQTDAPDLHDALIEEARASAPDQPLAKRGRPFKATPAQTPENAPQSPKSPVSEIPDWLRTAL